jgi:hypothetical protein
MTRHVGGASAGRPQRKLFVQQLHNSLAETLGRRLLKESFMFTEFEPKICFIPLCQRMISPASYSVGVNGDVHDIIKDVTGSIWAIPRVLVDHKILQGSCFTCPCFHQCYLRRLLCNTMTRSITLLP